MIESYIEIKLLPDGSFPYYQLMSELFFKLHLAFAKVAPGKFGVSFPQYDKSAMLLGNSIRIFSSTNNLITLSKFNWQGGLKDYLTVSEVISLPANFELACFKRVQINSIERERRRKMKRKGISYEETFEFIPKDAQQTINLPYINVKSLSTGYIARIYIQKIELISKSMGHDCCFSSYGLSSNSFVPIF